MKRRFSAITWILLIFSTILPVAARAEKVIYETISIIDPASIGWDITSLGELGGVAAVAIFTGKTTITDNGGGNYKFISTMQKDVALNFTITTPKVINKGEIQFYSPKDKETVVITPKKITMGQVSIDVISENAFSTLLNNLGGVPKKSNNSAGKNNTTKPAQKPAAPKKTYRNDPTLLKQLYGPMGYAPANPLMAGLQSWRDALKKGGFNLEEKVVLGLVWLNCKGKPVSILGNTAECTFKININEFETEYYIKDKSRAQADAIYEDIVQTLRASGVNMQPEKPSETFPLQSTAIWGDYKVDVHVYKQMEGNYWVDLKSYAKRNVPASENVTYVGMTDGPGENLFGIPGLKITAPIEEIEEKFKLKMIPGQIEGKNIGTYGKQGPCELKISINGLNKCNGLRSEYLSFRNDDGYRYYYAPFELWLQDGVGKYDFSWKEKNKMYQTLFDKIIESLKAEGKIVKKVSDKELKPYGLRFGAKAVWMVNNGSYKDYYLLTKDTYSKHIYLISVQNK